MSGEHASGEPAAARGAPGAPGAAPRAVVVSLSSVLADPRVRRQCQALVADGWRVTSVGYGDGPGEAAGAGVTGGWTHRRVPDRPYSPAPVARIARVAGLLAARALPGAARATWARQERHRALARALAGAGPADLVVANDYPCLPAALDLAARLGAGLLYDMHEYSAGERVEDPRWRLLYPPYIRVLEREAVAAGALLTTVSEGIARRVARDHGLAVAPTVVRNLPAHREVAPRPVGPAQLVHYHGVLSPGRGLEELLRSVPLWEPRLRLRVRGHGADDYRAGLARLAADLGVAGRVAVEGPVEADRLVEAAADADIGVHLLPGGTFQNRYALPNKLFEYLMAGLAVVTSDLPEMARVLRESGAGIVARSSSPADVAAALNGLDPARIAHYKRGALVAARSLCWDAERATFLAACRRAAARAAA